MPTYDLHPEARIEWRDAILWYHEDNPPNAARFNTIINSMIAEIVDAPLRYPEYLHGTRMRVAKPFPYLIVYRLVGAAVQIIAIAHGRRRPGYWKTRVYGPSGEG